MLAQQLSFPFPGDYSSLATGDAVRLDTDGTLVKAQADSDINSAVYGVVYVASADSATLCFQGRVRIVSHGWTIGRYVYLSQSTAGALTPTKPTSGIVYRVGIVVSDDDIFVRGDLGAAPEGGSSLGDMLKSVYDTNDDGSVDLADLATDANGLTGAESAGINKVWGINGSGTEGWKDDPAGGGGIPTGGQGGFYDDGNITDGNEFYDDGFIA